MTYGFFVNDQCNLKSNQYNCNMKFCERIRKSIYDNHGEIIIAN